MAVPVLMKTNVMLLLAISVIVPVTSADSSLTINIPRFWFIKDMKERLDQHTSPNYLLLPHIYRSFINAGANASFLANHQVSDQCLASLKLYYYGLIQKKSWAWRMYDSTGKQPAGIFLGATTWSGNFDECLNIATTNCVDGDTCEVYDKMEAQFCSVLMTHAPWRPKMIKAFKLPFPVPYSPFIIDVCVPSNCSREDIFNVVDAFLTIDNFEDNITVTNVNCHHRISIVNDVGAFVSVIILSLILVLVVLGTSYDIYGRRRKLRVKHGPEMTIGYSEGTDRFEVLKIVLPTRKRRSRRGTLSSSENMEQAMNKLNRKNGSLNLSQTQNASEVINESKDIIKLIDMQRLSSSPVNSESQEINEDIESNHNTESSPTSCLHEVSIGINEKDGMADDNTRLLRGQDVVASHINSSQSINRSLQQNEHPHNQASIIEVRPSHKSKKLTSSYNLLTDLLLSFSFRKNTRHILADGSADTLFCLNGIRVLSICWIVLGNVYAIIYQNPDIVANSVSAVKMTQSFWMQMVINTTLAADSFFVLSGTLMAYNFIKVKTKAGKHLKGWTGVMSLREYGFMIVHRLFRILPCYAVLLMTATNILPYLGRGPRWSYEIDSVKVCKKNWWSNMLFISNFYDSDNMVCLI